MGFSKEIIHKALKETENNQIRVAYQLLVDHRQILSAGAHFQPQLFGGFASSPPAWNAALPTTACLFLLTF